MSFYYLLTTNFKILYRNWRGIFWNLALPSAEYLALSFLHIGNIIGGTIGAHYAEYLLPGMIALSILQTGLFNTAYWIIDLKDRDVLKRLAATPLSNFELVSSVVISRLALMIAQAILLTILGIIFFGATISGSLFWSLLFIIVGGSAFMAIGILIASATSSYDEAAPITTGVNLIFTFLGNIFFPIAILPKPLQDIGYVLPITYFAEGLRNNFSMPGAHGSLFDLSILLIWTVLLGTWSSYSFKKHNR